jgi:hypothetical protein
MEITRVSMFSGIKRTKIIDITQEQYDNWLNGKNIQDVAPHLSPSDREFIITGVTDEEWQAEFND